MLATIRTAAGTEFTLDDDHIWHCEEDPLTASILTWRHEGTWGVWSGFPTGKWQAQDAVAWLGGTIEFVAQADVSQYPDDIQFSPAT